MKLVTLLSRATALSAAAFALALIFNEYAGVFYTVAASAFLLLIAARDYAPRARRWEPRTGTSPVAPHPRTVQALRLAA